MIVVLLLIRANCFNFNFYFFCSSHRFTFIPIFVLTLGRKKKALFHFRLLQEQVTFYFSRFQPVCLFTPANQCLGVTISWTPFSITFFLNTRGFCRKFCGRRRKCYGWRTLSTSISEEKTQWMERKNIHINDYIIFCEMFV